MFGDVKGSTRACLLVAVAAALSACAASHRALNGTEISAHTVSSSRLILGGRVRCTATASTPVEAGQALGVTFTFRNVSHRAVKVGLAPWDVRDIVSAGDGTRFDTQALVSPTIPYIPPTRLRPGTTRAVSGLGATARVRWRGPLRITPMCGRTRLPVLRVGVTAAGPPADDRAAVADVVAASGHLFDHCRPVRAGAPVRGEIDSPDGNSPPLRATCSVRLRREGRFWRARALVLSPPDLRYEPMTQPVAQPLASRENAEEIVWEFVVTKNGAVSVDGSERDASKSADRMATDWSWTGSAWEKTGDARCGGFGSAGGGADGPVIEFVSVCGS